MGMKIRMPGHLLPGVWIWSKWITAIACPVTRGGKSTSGWPPPFRKRIVQCCSISAPGETKIPGHGRKGRLSCGELRVTSAPGKISVEWASVVKNFQLNARHAAFSAPNSWNDPDMLEVGNPGLNRIEERSHFSMWVISAAPLWAGNDLTRMDAATRGNYTNLKRLPSIRTRLGPVRSR